MKFNIQRFLGTILAGSCILSVIAFPSCKKFVDIPLPVDQLSTTFVFANDSAAIQSITGIYSEMMNNSAYFSDGSMTYYGGMAADELYYYTASSRDEFTNNQVTPVNHGLLETSFWNPCYKFIYAANLAIEGATNSTSLSIPVKNLVLGEARFIRAFCFFHLVNIFGDVPLTLLSNYEVNQHLGRTRASVVYDQIISDLKEAQQKLLVTYPSGERVRPNQYAATALLSRIYLYLKDWSNAETEASTVINSGSYSLVPNLNNAFLANSSEAIWQLRPVNPTRNTWEGNQIIPSSASTTPTYLLTNGLMNSFEAGDQRKIAWTKSRSYSGQTLIYPNKYKVRTGSVVTEYYTVIRLAELLLIRAEARARQNKLTEAKTDINVIRNRAGLPNTIANSQPDLLLTIEQERRVELFAEWGHRWFDLIRTDRANAVLGLLKPTTWQITDILWPIPQTQINLNPSLTQNPGY